MKVNKSKKYFHTKYIKKNKTYLWTPQKTLILFNQQEKIRNTVNIRGCTYFIHIDYSEIRDIKLALK